MVSRTDILTVQQLCARAGIPRSTLRVYEREGLIVPDTRTHSGYRLFTPEAVDRLKAVLVAKELGFTLAEIRVLLDDPRGGEAIEADLRTQLAERLRVVEAKLSDLRALRASLLDMQAAAPGGLANVQESLLKLRAHG